VMRHTEDTDALHDEVLDVIVNIVPTRVKDELREFGVKVVLVPSIEEAFRKTGDRALAWQGLAEPSTGKYSPTTKTIYVAEGPIGSYGTYTYKDVLLGFGYAYSHLNGLANSPALREALEHDERFLPEDLKQKFARHGNSDDVLFAHIFSSLLHRMKYAGTEPTEQLSAEAERAHPRTLSFIRASISPRDQ